MNRWDRVGGGWAVGGDMAGDGAVLCPGPGEGKGAGCSRARYLSYSLSGTRSLHGQRLWTGQDSCSIMDKVLTRGTEGDSPGTLHGIARS